MKTFEIIEKFESLNELANEVDFNPETGEIIDKSAVISAMMEEIEGEASEKMEQLERVKGNINASVNAIDAEIKRLQARKKGLSANSESIKSLQSQLLKRVDGMKLKTDLHTFSFRKSKSVEILPFVDASMMPEEYRRVKYEFDKKALKKAIESGEEITGVELVENETLAVR